MADKFKADWIKAPEWAEKFGKKHVVHGNYVPVWYDNKRACSAIDVPNLSVLQAIQFKPKDITFIENKPTH